MATEAVRRAMLQAKCHHQQNNTQLFTGWMPFLSANQQCQSTEGNSVTLTESRFSCVICHNLTLEFGELPCFFGRFTVNLCSTSRVLPDRLPNSAHLPSITMKPNVLSSAMRSVNAFMWTHIHVVDIRTCQTYIVRTEHLRWFSVTF